MDDETNHDESSVSLETSNQLPHDPNPVSTSGMSNTSVLTPCTGVRVVFNQDHGSHLITPPIVDTVESSDPICKTYSLMGDNLDTNIKPRYKRIENHQGESLHYFHYLAIKDRISQLSQLAITPCHTCINSPQKMALQLLPTDESDSFSCSFDCFSCSCYSLIIL